MCDILKMLVSDLLKVVNTHIAQHYHHCMSQQLRGIPSSEYLSFFTCCISQIFPGFTEPLNTHCADKSLPSYPASDSSYVRKHKEAAG